MSVEPSKRQTRWQANFITPSFRSAGEINAPSPYLRRDFTVQSGLTRAVLHVTALGLIETHVNGRPIGDEVLTPGWTSYRHRLVVSSHDITAMLEVGSNAIGAVLADGWAIGRLTEDMERRNLWADRPAAFVQIELQYGDRAEIVVTDLSWRSATGAVLRSGIYDGESHDARLEPIGWDRPGFDDSSWAPVEVVEWDLGALVARDFPPIRPIEERTPVQILRTPSGRTVVDFGQNLAGWVRISVIGEPGTIVALRHAETLIDGEPEYETNRTAEATDRYTLRGQELETWEPSFTFHGFRYVDVEGWPGEILPDAIRAVVVHTDMARTGWFETSDELVNQLHSNVVWSMRGNFVGLPTDCPQRDERLGWTGDINAFAPTAAFLYDVRAVLGSWLADLGAEQLDKGYVPYFVPDVAVHPCPPTALWGDVAVALPLVLYEEYGDQSILELQYDSMARYVESVAERLDSRGLWSRGFQFGDWLDPDAPPENPTGAKTDSHLVATAFFCKTTAEMAKAARILGRADDAERFGSLHQRVRSAFRDEWLSPAGLVVNETATAYALAICFDILDPLQETRAGERLAQLVAKAGNRISTGFAGTPLVVHALSRTGQLQSAYAILLERGCPSFLYPVTMGATTIWERWDAIRPDGSLNRTGMTSLNHYALGAIADWLHRVVGGISPAQPGYRVVTVAPKPGGGLTFARVAHETPEGRVEVYWRLHEGARMSIEVVVPRATVALVVLPLHPEGVELEVGEGTHHWEYAVSARAERRAYTLDSPMSALARDPNVWPGITAVFAKYFPGHGGSGVGIGAAQGAEMSLREVLQIVPFEVDELKRDLLEAISWVTVG